MASKRWINVAVVGTGKIYNDAHREAYLSKTSDNMAVVGLCDQKQDVLEPQLKWLEKKYKTKLKKAQKKDSVGDVERFKFALDHLKGWNDYGKMLDALEGVVDLVDNCTHGRGHIPLSIQAMEHGYHAMAEKPPGTNWWDVRRVVDAEKKTGMQFQLNENVCYERPTQRAKQVVQEGHVGKINEVIVSFGHGGPYVPYQFGETGLPHFIDPVLSGGGCLQDLAPHGISMAFFPIYVDYPGSRVVSCKTSVLERRKNPRMMSGKPFESPVDDWAEAELTMKDPRTGSEYVMRVTTSWCGAPGAFPFSIEGDAGSMTVVQNPKSKQYEPAVYPEDDDADERFFEVPDDKWDPHRGHTREIQIFCQRLLDGGKTDTPGSYALALQEILSIHYFSALKGKEVTVDELDAFGEEMAGKHPGDPQAAVDAISKELTSAVKLL